METLLKIKRYMKIIIFSTVLLVCVLLSGTGIAQDPPASSQPVDADLYLIRPGDQLTVTFVKSKLQPLTLKVDPEGRIVDENLGVFDLTGMTLAETRAQLSETLKRLYSVAEMAISISESRSVRISVTGAVYNPGSYEGFTNERVSDIIAQAGGVLDDGSRRWIQFTGGPKDLTVDPDRSAFLGDLDANPCLYAGSRIIVPSKSPERVQVVGEVNSPREIELMPGDDIPLLLALAGGVRSFADTLGIRLLGRDEPGGPVVGGDIIMVPASKSQSTLLSVAIFGEVSDPGFYAYNENMRLPELVKAAGGFTSIANAGLTTVFRRPAADEAGRKTYLRFPVTSVIHNDHEYIPISLKPDDSVFVPVTVGYVQVEGLVSCPGFFPYVEGKDAAYYIDNAGGFLPTANRTEIGLYNPISRMTAVASPDVRAHDGSKIIVKMREELR